MNRPITFPALGGGEHVEITAAHGALHAFSTRSGSQFYIVCADAKTPTASRRMGVDFWGGMNDIGTLGRATALARYENRIAVSTIGGTLAVGSVDRPIAATLNIGNSPRGCLAFVSGNILVVGTSSGSQDALHVVTFDDNKAVAQVEATHALLSVPNSIVASDKRVAVGEVAGNACVYSVLCTPHDDGRKTHSLVLTHIVPGAISVMALSNDVLLVRDDSSAADVRVMRLKHDHAIHETSIKCNNANVDEGSIACIEEDGGNPALVLYKSHDENSIKRLHPQRLVGVGDAPESDALGFVISVSGRNAVVTSRSTAQMWVLSY